MRSFKDSNYELSSKDYETQKKNEISEKINERRKKYNEFLFQEKSRDVKYLKYVLDTFHKIRI
jgi:hypothetical protein